jgi:hypothetical protein
LNLLFLSEGDVTSRRAEVERNAARCSTNVAGSDFWTRAMAELARRQTNAQISLARSVAHATWALVFTTFLLTLATLVLAVTKS